MHKAYVCGIEGTGFLPSLTLCGALLGPRDVNWGARVREGGGSTIREAWALPSISPLCVLLSVASPGQKEKSLEITCSPCAFLWCGVG